MKPILVINPNASESVTSEIASSVAGVAPEGVPVECVTLSDGPPAVETQQDVDWAAEAILPFAEARSASAVIVACYSDPGLERLRKRLYVPVYGIGQTSMMTAMLLGELFGIIAVAPPSVGRQQDYVRRLKLQERYAGSRDVGMGVRALATDPEALPRLIDVGRGLCDECGADVVILGCAGMAGYRAEVEAALGVPVLEPTRATVAIAAGLLPLMGPKT